MKDQVLSISPEEFLKEDNSYLIIPHKTSNIFSKAFWSHVGDKPHTLAGTTGNQREAYEMGIKIGWELATKYLEHGRHNPHPAYMSKQEAADITSIMTALGVQFEYMVNPPVCIYDSVDIKSIEFQPGLNVTKNTEAIRARVTVSDEVKQQVINLLKQHTPRQIWKN